MMKLECKSPCFILDTANNNNVLYAQLDPFYSLEKRRSMAYVDNGEIAYSYLKISLTNDLKRYALDKLKTITSEQTINLNDYDAILFYSADDRSYKVNNYAGYMLAKANNYNYIGFYFDYALKKFGLEIARILTGWETSDYSFSSFNFSRSKLILNLASEPDYIKYTNFDAKFKSGAIITTSVAITLLRKCWFLDSSGKVIYDHANTEGTLFVDLGINNESYTNPDRLFLKMSITLPEEPIDISAEDNSIITLIRKHN